MELVEEAPAAVARIVPYYVARTQTRFTRCPACRRVYWPATHARAMAEEIKKLLARVAETPPEP